MEESASSSLTALHALHSCSTSRADMNKENGAPVKFGEPTARITRAQAKGLSILEGLPLRRPSRKHDHKPPLKQSSKRTASDENNSSISYTSCFQHKKRALLKDVTNIFSDPRVNCIQFSKQANKGIGKKTAKVAPAIFIENSCVQEMEANITEEMSTVETKDSHEPILPVNLKEDVAHEQTKPTGTRKVGEASMILAKQNSNKITYPKSAFRKGGKSCENLEASTSLESLQIADVDSNHKDPLMCSMYAPDIYSNLLVMELDRRPSVNYMEILQREITPGMRGVLVDWLVEVSEEHKLVPDTLYLTVNIVDRFLSQNHIEKQRLQLLGVTSMLIASKYEEICAPSVEELCVITDNTYKREEVVKMESQVLNFLGFHLSFPTTKKFLRRFIQAAQTSFKVPCVELEFLANYLAELTLLEYKFLKFLPSLIAASAVFLARWTLNQSDHPWNPTLEHYTSYVPSDLKGSVLALQQLQLNSNECSLKAIREKYRQQKFKCVANLSSPEAVDSVF